MRLSIWLPLTLAAMLSLAACTKDDVNATVTKVQATTAQVCGFVPAAASVAAILTGGNPAVATAAGAASAICTAIAAKAETAPQSALLGFGETKQEDCVVMVSGVCVQGAPVDKNGK